jgi:hypothetical protein
MLPVQSADPEPDRNGERVEAKCEEQGAPIKA